MNQHVGIWIDHKTAMIVSVSRGHVATKTLASNIDAHPRYSGQEGGGGEKKYELRHREQLDHYYDTVIRQLARPEGILIFGPGEAKLELRERLGRSKVFSECVVNLETADKLTDAQIVATVKEHFAIAR